MKYCFCKDFIYVLLERGDGKEKEREKSMCGCFLCAPYWGPGPLPRHVPWLGIELAILGFTGWHSIHWATPARVKYCFHRSSSTLWSLVLYSTQFGNTLLEQGKMKWLQGQPQKRNYRRLVWEYEICFLGAKKFWVTIWQQHSCLSQVLFMQITAVK